MKRSVVYTEDEIVNRLHDVHGDRVIMVGRYVNMKTKIMWRHIDYGEWVSTPDHVINRGHSHPSIPRKSRKIDRTCVQCGCSTSYSKWHSGPTCHNCYIKVYNKTRLSLNNRLSMRMRTRMWSAIKNSSKSGSTLDLLGCSIEELKQYLESRFQPGMTWENYGKHGWHIDHVRPLASFDLSCEQQQFYAFNYKNLQPLWWRDNLAKGSRYE